MPLPYHHPSSKQQKYIKYKYGFVCVSDKKKKKRLNIFKNQIRNRNAKETVDRSVQESCFYGRMGLKIVLRERLGLEPTSLLENRECAEGSLITQRKGALKICLFGGRMQTQPHNQDLAVLCADLVAYPGYSATNEEQNLLTANI